MNAHSMGKLVAAINLTLDGIFDHTAVTPDEEIHQHYTELINNAGAIIYGRITYQLMEYWRPMVENPSGEKSMDDFAQAINKIPKIVFSHTLKNVDWVSAKLASRDITEEVSEILQQNDKDTLVGSRSLILQLMKLKQIDEYQFCVHPVIAGKGLRLFEGLNDRLELKLVRTKKFTAGAVVFYYEPLSR